MLQSAKWYPVCFSPPIGWAAVQGNCLVPEICWQPPALCSSERGNGVNSSICICPCCSDRQPDSCSPASSLLSCPHAAYRADCRVGCSPETPEMLGKPIDTSLTAVLGTYDSGKIQNSLYCIVDAYGTRGVMWMRCRSASPGYRKGTHAFCFNSCCALPWILSLEFLTGEWFLDISPLMALKEPSKCRTQGIAPLTAARGGALFCPHFRV